MTYYTKSKQKEIKQTDGTASNCRQQSLTLMLQGSPISQWSIRLMSKVRTEEKCSTGLCCNLHMLSTSYTNVQSFKQDYAFWISHTIYNKWETTSYGRCITSNADTNQCFEDYTTVRNTQADQCCKMPCMHNHRRKEAQMIWLKKAKSAAMGVSLLNSYY